VWPTLEDLRGNGPHHRDETVAESTLRDHHQPHQRIGRRALHEDEREVAEGEAETPHRPHPLAPDAVGEMAEGDLARDGDQAYEAESPRGVGRAEADLDQILGLVYLDGVPGEEPAKVAGGDPPEARRAHGAAERP